MKTSLKPGDIVLRREKGNEHGQVLGQAVVLRTRVKSNLPHKTDLYQKVRFCFVGSDPTKKSSRTVGDLFFSDYIAKCTTPAIKRYIKERAAADKIRAAEEAAAMKVRKGKIPVPLFRALDGHVSDSVLDIVRGVFA